MSANSHSLSSGRARPRRASTRRRSSVLVTWGTVALVLVIVVVLVVVKFTQSPPAAVGADVFQPAPSAIVNQVTHIPESVYDAVRVSSPVAPVSPPIAVSGQPTLTYSDSQGQPALGILYYGAEYCPYCAAERWALIAALSRFGTFSGLGETNSSLTDEFPGTATFTLVKATLSSPDVALQAVERYTNVQGPDGSYRSLQVPTAAQAAEITKYDAPQYVGGGGGGGIPFVSIGNRYLIAGASYSPALLTGLSRQQIAAGLDNPKNPATQAIVATANYITAAICQADGGQPASICSSKGVVAATAALSSGS